MTSNDTTLVFEGKLPITTKHTFWGKIACKDIATQEKYKCSCSIYCPQQISDNQKKKTLASGVTVWLVGSSSFLIWIRPPPPPPSFLQARPYTATHLQHMQITATHCNTRQRTHNTRQYTVTHTQHTATYCNCPPPAFSICMLARLYCLSFPVVAHCDTLKHTATHRNTLQQHTLPPSPPAWCPPSTV